MASASTAEAWELRFVQLKLAGASQNQLLTCRLFPGYLLPASPSYHMTCSHALSPSLLYTASYEFVEDWVLGGEGRSSAWTRRMLLKPIAPPRRRRFKSVPLKHSLTLARLGLEKKGTGKGHQFKVTALTLNPGHTRGGGGVGGETRHMLQS